MKHEFNLSDDINPIFVQSIFESHSLYVIKLSNSYSNTI